MPIIKSAIKRVRQSAKRRSRNLHVKRSIQSDIRTLTDAVVKKDGATTSQALRAAISEIDRAVKKGSLHKNTAARRKSQLTKLANTVSAPKKTAKKATPKKTAKPTPKAKAATKPSQK